MRLSNKIDNYEQIGVLIELTQQSKVAWKKITKLLLTTTGSNWSVKSSAFRVLQYCSNWVKSNNSSSDKYFRIAPDWMGGGWLACPQGLTTTGSNWSVKSVIPYVDVCIFPLRGCVHISYATWTCASLLYVDACVFALRRRVHLCFPWTRVSLLCLHVCIFDFHGRVCLCYAYTCASLNSVDACIFAFFVESKTSCCLDEYA